MTEDDRPRLWYAGNASAETVVPRARRASKDAGTIDPVRPSTLLARRARGERSPFERRLAAFRRLVQAILDVQPLEHELRQARRQAVGGFLRQGRVLRPFREVGDDLLQQRVLVDAPGRIPPTAPDRRMTNVLPASNHSTSGPKRLRVEVAVEDVLDRLAEQLAR